jgi:hypothetical protein
LPHAEEKFGYLMQGGVTPHTAKDSIWVLCSVFGEINGEDRIIGKGLWPPRSPDLNPCDFYLRGKLSMTWRIWNRIFVKLFTTFSNANCTKFPEICLIEFRHVSQQRTDIFNIF